jgi:hypothetical protein
MWWLGLLLLIGTVALLVRLGRSGRKLVTPFAPRGGVSLQLAKSPEFASTVIRSWDKAGVIRLARRQIYVDFLLIVFYSSLFVFACAQLQSAFPSGALTKLVFVSASSKFVLLAFSAVVALTLFIELVITRVL